MIDPQINKLIRSRLMPNLEAYKYHDGLIYQIDEHFFLKGYQFELSGSGPYNIAVWCFVQPLFVKHNGINLAFGDRLKYKVKLNWLKTAKKEWWDAGNEHVDETFRSIMQVILADGEKYLATFKTAGGFYNQFKEDATDDIKIYEAVAYTTVWQNDEALMRKMLHGLIDLSLTKVHRETDWMNELRNDTKMLLNAKSSMERKELLAKWAKETLWHIKLPERLGA